MDRCLRMHIRCWLALRSLMGELRINSTIYEMKGREGEREQKHFIQVEKHEYLTWSN